MTDERYSVGTWDTDLQAYTPQVGAGRSINITIRHVRRVLKRLRQLDYSAHRIRDADGEHWENDTSVIVEKTTGKTRAEILESWKR